MPFTESTYSLRREHIQQRVKSEDISGLFVSNLTNIRYLTGYSGSSATLLIGNQNGLLISDARYEEQIKEECPGIEVFIRPTEAKLSQATIGQIQKMGWSKIGFEANFLSVAEFENYSSELKSATWKNTFEWVESLRVIKDADEITSIRSAVQLAEEASKRFVASLKPEDNEIGLFHRMEQYLRDAGAMCGSFPSIIGAGSRAALPHSHPTARPIGNEPLLLVDWGARHVSGYISDLTRTYEVRKNSNNRFKEVYRAVREAQERAASALRPGIQAVEVDNAARAALEKAGFLKYFNHGLGHGIGLEVHEGPSIRPLSTTILEKGMVVTLEPGVYLPGWGGIRVEDDFLITDSGAESLSTLPRELEEMTLAW